MKIKDKKHVAAKAEVELSRSEKTASGATISRRAERFDTYRGIALVEKKDHSVIIEDAITVPGSVVQKLQSLTKYRESVFCKIVGGNFQLSAEVILIALVPERAEGRWLWLSKHGETLSFLDDAPKKIHRNFFPGLDAFLDDGKLISGAIIGLTESLVQPNHRIAVSFHDPSVDQAYMAGIQLAEPASKAQQSGLAKDIGKKSVLLNFGREFFKAPPTSEQLRKLLEERLADAVKQGTALEITYTSDHDQVVESALQSLEQSHLVLTSDKNESVRIFRDSKHRIVTLLLHRLVPEKGMNARKWFLGEKYNSKEESRETQWLVAKARGDEKALERLASEDKS